MSLVNVSNLGFGGSGVPDVLPKAVAELQGMKLQFVDGAAAETVMPIEGMDPEDTIGAVLNMTDSESVDLDTIEIAGRNAKAYITCLDTAQEDDTVTVNGKVYTIKDVDVHPSYNAPPFVVPISIDPSGNDAEELADRLAKAIMSGDSSLTTSVEEDDSSPPLLAKIKVQVREPGTAGNATTLSESGTAVTVSGATFSGGAAEAGQGFTCTDSLAGKNLLVLWYDKNPGQGTNPLMMSAKQAPPSGPQTMSTAQATKPQQKSSTPSNLKVKK